MFFKKRLPEPKEMEEIELDVFEKISKESYKRWIIPLVDDVLTKSELRKGRILDVGCGPGLLVRELGARSKKFDVFGIDISGYAIKQAKKNCRGLKNVFLKRADAYKLPFPDNFFDLIVCKDNLHQFPRNPIAILSEMIRVLKTGNLIYIHDLKRDVPKYLLKRVIPPDNTFKKLLYYSARAAYTRYEVIGFMKKIGAKEVSVITRRVTPRIRKRYSKLGIDINLLKESFQSRYVAIGKK